MKNSASDQHIKAFLAERRLVQRQKSQLQKIDRSCDVQIKRLESVSSGLRTELASYGKGMTNLGDYFKPEARVTDTDTIVFPLVRSRSDWEPKPCWLGKAAVNENRCYHFPCRNITSYHFMFRYLPKFILDRADETVRQSKESSDKIDVINTPDDVMVMPSERMRKPNPKDQMTDCSEFKLPVLKFPENMTEKERQLKTTIHKKRLQNEMENKPPDRNVNYGKPTAIRRLKRPVRPVVRHVDLYTDF